MEFEADPKVSQIADAFAADMVDFAKSQFQVDLDFTIDSVVRLEEIAESTASSKPRFSLFRRDATQKTEGFSKMLGFYLAETMRREWGGEHGWVTADGNRFYGLKLSDGALCWPVGRAEQPITQGRENDLTVYVAGIRPAS